MTLNPTITCCCGKTLCCIAAKISHTCPKSRTEGCGSVPDGSQTLEYWRYFKFCVNTEDECNCSLIDGQGQEGADTVVQCTATFRPDKKCDGDTPPTGVCYEPSPSVCTVWECSPCGPIAVGCTLLPPGESCPPVPDCPIDPCCNPTPKLCCCRTLVNGCVSSASCISCTGPSSTGNGQNGTVCAEVQNCNGCTPDDGAFITTMCCATCMYVDLDGDGIFDDWFQDCGSMPTTVCCDACGPASNPGCESTICVPPCSSGGSGNLCPCPIQSVTPGCPSPFAPRYGTAGNSAEGRYNSGVVYDGAAYKLNTLFLFGYGYEHL